MRGKFFVGALALGMASAIMTGNIIPAQAGPGQIEGPHVEKGEFEIKSISTFGFDYDDSDHGVESEFGIEYGITDRLLIEVEFEIEDEHEQDAEFAGYGAVLRYELAEPGALLIDTALEVGYEFSGTGGADAASFGVLLGKEIGAYEVLSNIGALYEIGEDSQEGIAVDLAIGAYREFTKGWAKDWEFGVEYFADIGNLADQNGYTRQGHFIGPIAGSEVHVNDNFAVEYKIGYYQGISREADDGTVKLELGFEF